MYQRVIRKDVPVRNMKWYVEFRMTYPIFVELCDVLRPYIEHKDTNCRPTLSAEKVVAIIQKKIGIWLEQS